MQRAAERRKNLSPLRGSFSLTIDNHGLWPWLRSIAAPRLSRVYQPYVVIIVNTSTKFGGESISGLLECQVTAAGLSRILRFSAPPRHRFSSHRSKRLLPAR